MNAQAGAVERAGGRAVQSMSLALKDAVLDDINYIVDDATPYMLKKGAYQAGKPVKPPQGPMSTSTIAPDQAEVLPYGCGPSMTA